ncbi:MAG: hypothetical protein Q9M48_15290 [Rhodobacterales bacterium]|nr:hypothetical protein [Rhodobacterales bacterium]
MTLTLLHTAEVHRETFDTLAARIAPKAKLVHHVRVDWLARAKDGIDDALEHEISRLVVAAGPVICTCTSLGEVAATYGAIRIDQPMMACAADIGGPVLLVFSVETTRGPSTALLENAIRQSGQTPDIHPLFVGEYWPLFLAGDIDGFHRAIAKAVQARLSTCHDIASVVLAQASMMGATKYLEDLEIPVLTSPELALRAGLNL